MQKNKLKVLPGGKDRTPIKRQIDGILDAADAQTQVRRMSSVQLHHLITAVGVSDAHDLIALATPDQVRELVDLDIWQHDSIDYSELLLWFQALCRLPDATRKRNFAHLDVELLAYTLIAKTKVIVLGEDDVEGTTNIQLLGPGYQTPDGWFVVDFQFCEPEESEQLILLLETLYRDDADAARRLLQSAVWEIPSQLEEQSLRWRNARLEDLGFADPVEAMEIYAYLDPASVKIGEGTADRFSALEPATGIALMPADLTLKNTFWAKVVAELDSEEEKQRIGRALVSLSNRALSADRIIAADIDGARNSLTCLLGRLSLGLEYLSEQSTTRAVAILADIALVRISRVGHSLVLDKRKPLAAPWRQGQLGSQPKTCDNLNGELQPRIEALMAEKPLMYTDDRDVRAFSSLDDLSLIQSWVDAALKHVNDKIAQTI